MSRSPNRRRRSRRGDAPLALAGFSRVEEVAGSVGPVGDALQFPAASVQGSATFALGVASAALGLTASAR